MAAVLTGGIDPEFLANLHRQRHLDTATLDSLEQMGESFAAEMWNGGSRHLAPVIRDQHVKARMLVSGSRQSAIARRLTAHAGKLALLLGRLARHTDNRGDALMYWSLAESMAIDAGDHALKATVRADTSHYYSDRNALSALDSAFALVGSAESPYLTAWMLTKRARAHAALGNSVPAMRDLERAHSAVNNTDQHAAGYFVGWSSQWLASYEADCGIRLGRYRESADRLEALLASSNPAPYHRLALLGDLGVAYAHDGEIQRACATLSTAIDMAATLDVPEQFGRINQIRADCLWAWPHEAAVKDLAERLHAASGGIFPP